MLTENQQHLINQITQEFSNHNKLQTSNHKSLLGIDIINSVNAKRKLIEEIKIHNSGVFASMSMLCEKEMASLKEELDMLDIPLSTRNGWFTISCGEKRIEYCIGNNDSNYRINLAIKIDGHFVDHEGNLIYEVKKLQPKLIYDYMGNEYSFDELCSSKKFTDHIKKIYEHITK